MGGGSSKFLTGLPGQILAALVLGLSAGPFLGKDALFLGEISALLIRLIKAIALPLLFFAVWDAVAKAEAGGKGAVKMVLIAFFNASLALIIGLGVSNVFKPGEGFIGLEKASPADVKKIAEFAGKKVEFSSFISGLIPGHILQPFIEQNVIALVLLSVLLGIASRGLSRERGLDFTSFTEKGMQLFEYALRFPIALLPLAVFGSVARTVGEYGYDPLWGLAKYVGAGLLGFLIHVLIVYQGWIRWYAGMSLKKFWKEAKLPLGYALGSNSSLATLPVTLTTLEKKLGVSPGSAKLGACIGTNLNNDGILLYEAMAVLFIAQAYGITLTLEQQAGASFTCILAAIGIAGVPEAGIISLTLVLSTAGLPVTLLPILLSADWILARCRSAVNVLSDMTVSIALDKTEKVK